MTEIEVPTRSSRDPQELRARLERWLASVLAPEAAPAVGPVASPGSSGMSSETLLFDATWTEHGVRKGHELVARIAPDDGDVPVFPRYDLEAQFRLLRLVAQHSRVPVPATRWLELDPEPLGAPFFVMERVHGRVPPDVPPYTFGGWVVEASDAERRRLQDATVRIVADLHAIDVSEHDLSFLDLRVDGDTALRRHVAHQREYYDWVRGDRRHPVIERTFEWLEEHWPHDEGDTVVSWGDARIGNVMYDGFDPVAVFDWEMAALAPRGVDLGWMSFLHTFFQDITTRLGLPGLPDFMRLADVRRTYAEHAGVDPGDLRWYEVYAGLRHGIVMARVHARSVRFGEAEWPDDPDATIPHRGVLEEMLAGTWWDGERPGA
jgi:aminoglycoside phosphotransferase (APT) family kinase protein